MKLTRLCPGFLKRYYTGVCNATNPPKVLNMLKDGDKISIHKTITSDDVLRFAELTGDCNPIHMKSPNNLVHGALLNGFISGVIGTRLPGPGTVVVEQNLKYPKPCYAGDSIEISVQIVSVRKIIKCEYICVANGERVVLKGEAKLIQKSQNVQ